MREAINEYGYDEIDDLVIKYQNGDKKAAETLLLIFEPYIKKFLRIIKDGLINLEDKDSRKFIGLFIKDQEIRRKLTKSYQSSETKYKAYGMTSFLYNICRDMSAEDITQELSLVLLVLAKRWKKKGKKVNFCGYVYSTFKFEVYRRFKKIIEEPLIYRADVNLSYNDESYITELDDVYDDPRLFADEIIMLIDEDLGNSWIRGITCSEIFSNLTPFQRMLLKMHHIDGKSDVEIAARTGLHRNTIRKYREKAELILKQNRDDLNENNEV